MHNIDRTQRELEAEGHELEQEYEQELEQEYEQEHEHGEAEHESFLGSLFGEAEHEQEFEHENELEYEHELEHEHELEYEAESPLSEAQEMELASELLEVSSEAELEQFLGGLFRRAVKGARKFARSSAGKALGGMLKRVAKKALPIAGRAVGGLFGGPLGSTIGGTLGSAASNLFELELEGLSHEDREFEVARQFVRLGAGAARAAARMPRVPPASAARRALTSSARIYAPGLLRRSGARVRPGCRHCGGGVRRRAVNTGRGQHGSLRRRGVRRTFPRGSYGPGVPVVTAGDYVDASPLVDGTDVAYASNQRTGRWVRRGNKVVLLGL